MLNMQIDYLRTGVGNPISTEEMNQALAGIDIASKQQMEVSEFDFEALDFYTDENRILLKRNNINYALINLEEAKVYIL